MSQRWPAQGSGTGTTSMQATLASNSLSSPTRRLFANAASSESDSRQDPEARGQAGETETERTGAEKHAGTEGTEPDKADGAKSAGAEDTESAQSSPDTEGAATDSAEAAAAESAKGEEKPKLSPLEQLQKEKEELEKKAGEKQHEFLLALADFENEKRRMEKELANKRAYASMGFAREVVGVFDKLESIQLRPPPASDKEPDNVDSFCEGIALTRDIFQKALDKFGCERLTVEPGTPFSATQHESVKEIITAEQDLPDQSVAEVISPGWTFKASNVKFTSDVLRKAKVAVVKRGPATPPSPP